MEPKTTDKRIVSKSAYVAIRIAQGSLYVSGISLMAIAGLSFLTSAACGLHFMRCIALLVKTLDRTLFVNISLYGTAMGMLAGAAYLLGKAGYMAVTKAENLPEFLPLTPETVEATPALNSLVRASEEPSQVQEAVLLRATIQEQETPPEQLVRASVG